jgi:hypothetical protein
MSAPIQLTGLKPDNKVRNITFKVQPDLYNWLAAQAHARRTNMSYIVRDLIAAAMKAEKEGTK